MPTKFVQNTAARMGTSVEHAEKVWHDAKQAVKKGKRQGSWYWGKVVNTFKRMMGIKEHITFAEFAELIESEELNEAKGDPPSIPQGTRDLLKTLGSEKVIMLMKGYYLEFNDVRPLKATWNFRRLMRDMTEQDHMYMVVARRGGADGKYIMQAWGDPIESLKWDQRSKMGTLEEVKPFDKQSMKEFGIGILAYAGLLKEEKEQ